MKRRLIGRVMLILLCILAALPVFAETETGTKPGQDRMHTEVFCVSYLGPRGTYTEEATILWFGNGAELMPEDTVEEAIAALTTGKTDFAVIPQENTLGGAVVSYLDALIAAEDTYVTGEIILPISQTLMGIPGTKLTDIRTVCSHAQGLIQSETWLAEYLPGVKAKEMPSTAAAAGYVAEQQNHTIAAIAAPGAANLYGLEVLAENVQITSANKTRFYVLSRQQPEKEGFTHAVFIATCGGNQIAGIVSGIQEAGLELVCLHDRPEGSALGRYHFVIEVSDETGIQLSQILKISGLENVRFAGCFDIVEKETGETDDEQEHRDAA